jgi:hypothetical protein
MRGTALGRPVDLRYASNRLAVAGAAVAGLVAAVATLLGEGLSLSTASRVGVGVFLAWALTRELSPDHVGAANVAMVFAAGLSIVATPSIGVNLVALIAVRAWAGTVGHHPSVIDFAGAVILAAYAGANPEVWAACGCLGVALLAYSPHRASAAITLGLMTGAAVASGIAFTPSVDFGWSVADAATLAVTLTLALWILPIRSLRSTTDRRAQPISPRRVSLGWAAAWIAIAGAGWLGPQLSTGPIVAAVAAAGLAQIAERRATNRSPGPAIR